MKNYNKSATVQMILQRLVTFGKKGGTQGWKVLGVTTFHKQMTTWAETVEGKGVIYSKNDKYNPSAPKTEKAKEPTKAELKAQLVQMLAQIAALTPKTNDKPELNSSEQAA